MKRSFRIIGVLVALSVLAVVMAYVAGLFEDKRSMELLAPTPDQAVGEVFVAAITKEPRTETYIGTVRARREAIVSARITSRVTSMAVRSGDSVKAGDTLATLDDRELASRLAQQRQQVRAARARLSEAQPEYDRMRTLFDSGAVSKSALERALAAVTAAGADLERSLRAVDEARTALSYAHIVAPISGRIVERFAEPGDTVTPGAAMLRLYDPSALRLEAAVRESLAVRLRRGEDLTVWVDALGIELPVTVDEIVPAADAGARSFVIKASLPETGNLYPGMFGRLLIVTEQVQRLAIPRAAVHTVGQLQFVQVVAEERVERRFVRMGRVMGDRVEILSGLASGERIALGGGG